jgi:hypothetical protein
MLECPYLRSFGLTICDAPVQRMSSKKTYRKVLRNLGHTYPSSAAPYLIATDADVEDEQGDLIDIFVNPHIEKRGTK